MSGMDAASLSARHRDLRPTIEPARDGVLEIHVEAAVARTLLRRLRDEGESVMGQLMDLTAVDPGPAQAWLDLVYWLRSTDGSNDLRVFTRLEQTPEAGAGGFSADSVVSLWACAGWLEREAFDLFGIDFLGHPDLRRLLLEPEFEGAPLRKDFSVEQERPLSVPETGE